jgi:phosphate-selective porin OprO/OprP
VAQNEPRLPPGGGGTAATDDGVAQPRVSQNETHIFSLQSPDGQYSISLAGVAQFDAGDYVGFHHDSKVVGPQALSNGVNARRARIGVSGTAAGGWSYAFIYDAGNSQDTTPKGIETAQIVYGGIKGAAFEVGYSNTFFTLDQSTSGNDLLFLERATPSDIATAFNTGDYRSNAGVRLFSDRYWLGAYLTGPASGDSHTLTAERFGAFQRAAYQVLKGPDYSLHLGVGVDELFQASNAGNGTADTLTLSDQPELRIDPTTLLTSGTIGSTAHPVTGGYVLDLETAATFKGFTWQGEYYHYQVDRGGLAGASFDGGYGQVAYSLTGESHKYNPQAASYFRIIPSHPFSLKDGGLGAWEIAGRVSYVDLNSDFAGGEALAAHPAAIDGGRQTGYTLGLNWYPNDLVRFMLDYNHVEVAKSNGAAVTGAALGVPIGARLDAVSLRSQVVF